MRLNCTCICNNDIKEQPKYNPQECHEIVQGYSINDNINVKVKCMQCLLCQKQLTQEYSCIKTKCEHDFCLECFMKNTKKKGNTYCPWCNMLLHTMESKPNTTTVDNSRQIMAEIDELTKSIRETIKSM
jgi:hypothetical protein